MTRYSSTMKETLADIREGFSQKDIKMAIGVAKDKRYAHGNYTGAVKAIEKIKKGLSNHPRVKEVLQQMNEEPASPDEKSMAIKQSEFVEYVGREIGEHLEADKDFPEWMQNKLSELHQKAKDMHSTLGAHGSVEEEVELDEAGDVGEYVVTQGEGDNAQKVIAVEKDKNKAIKIRDDWNKKNNPAKPSHRARVYAQTKISLKRNKQKVGQDISWSTYGNKGQFTKLKEEVELKEDDYKVGDRVQCKASGALGVVSKVDPSGTGAYYTVKRDDGKMMKYKPDELTTESIEEGMKRIPEPDLPKTQRNELKNLAKAVQGVLTKVESDGKSVQATIVDTRNRDSGFDRMTVQFKALKEACEVIAEKLKVSDGLGAWITDFQKSDAPQFDGKSDEQKKKMAIAAFVDAGGKLEQKEEVELDEKGTPVFVKITGKLPHSTLYNSWKKFSELLKKHKGKLKQDTFSKKGSTDKHSILFLDDRGWKGFKKDYDSQLHKKPLNDNKDFEKRVWDLKFQVNKDFSDIIRKEEVELDEKINANQVATVAKMIAQKVKGTTTKSDKGNFIVRKGKSKIMVGFSQSGEKISVSLKAFDVRDKKAAIQHGIKAIESQERYNKEELEEQYNQLLEMELSTPGMADLLKLYGLGMKAMPGSPAHKKIIQQIDKQRKKMGLPVVKEEDGDKVKSAQKATKIAQLKLQVAKTQATIDKLNSQGEK